MTSHHMTTCLINFKTVYYEQLATLLQVRASPRCQRLQSNIGEESWLVPTFVSKVKKNHYQFIFDCCSACRIFHFQHQVHASVTCVVETHDWVHSVSVTSVSSYSRKTTTTDQEKYQEMFIVMPDLLPTSESFFISVPYCSKGFEIQIVTLKFTNSELLSQHISRPKTPKTCSTLVIV